MTRIKFLIVRQNSITFSPHARSKTIKFWLFRRKDLLTHSKPVPVALVHFRSRNSIPKKSKTTKEKKTLIDSIASLILTRETLYLCLNFVANNLLPNWFTSDQFQSIHRDVWLARQNRLKCNLFQLSISISIWDPCNDLCGRLMMSFPWQEMDLFGWCFPHLSASDGWHDWRPVEPQKPEMFKR